MGLGEGAAWRVPRLASWRWIARAVVMTSPHFWRVYSLGLGAVWEWPYKDWCSVLERFH
jgi:hypothetical protein